MPVIAQRGFSMVEVMASIVVLGVGVLGVAGMLLAAVRTSQQSVFQTTALQLASELADKMRANDRIMKDAETNPFFDIDYSTTEALPETDFVCYGEKINCDAASLAEFDILEWQQRLKSALPPARVVVCQDSTPWSESAGRYEWECDSAGTGGAVVIKIGWQAKNPDGTLIRDADNEFSPSLALAVAPYIK